MGFRMKTTLNLTTPSWRNSSAKQHGKAAQCPNWSLRLLLRSQRKPGRIPALPTFRSGGTLVEIADRDALYQATEGRILLAVDTNVLVYAADADSQFYRPSTTARVRARAKR